MGANLALRVAAEIAEASGPGKGEQAEFQTRGGACVIRLPEAFYRARALAAAGEIMPMSRENPLRMTQTKIKEAVEEGRDWRSMRRGLSRGFCLTRKAPPLTGCSAR